MAALSCRAFLFGHEDTFGLVTWLPRGLAGWPHKGLLTTQGCNVLLQILSPSV